MSSDTDDNFARDLDSQSYEFKSELKIRKVLEQHTDWQFEFSKNGQYKYDLAITEWESSPQTPDDNDVIGYVELERSRRDKKHSWVTGSIPKTWPYLSFLQRKVRDFDHDKGKWQGVKDNYHRTVYLKFNHALDNCFAAPIEVIHKDGNRTKRSDGSYNATYLKLDKSHGDVHTGTEDCVNFIREFLTQRETEQEPLARWL